MGPLKHKQKTFVEQADQIDFDGYKVGHSTSKPVMGYKYPNAGPKLGEESFDAVRQEAEKELEELQKVYKQDVKKFSSRYVQQDSDDEE